MKTFFILLLSGHCLVAADDVRAVMSVTTNSQTGAVTTMEFYTRHGRTNLVRHTYAKARAIQFRIHSFSHDGAPIGSYAAFPESSIFTTQPGARVSIALEYDKHKDVKGAQITSGHGEVLDAFRCTNGMFYPIESAQLRNMNSVYDAVRAKMEKSQ